MLWQWQQSEKNRALADASLYAADMKLAQQAWEEGNLAYAQALLRAHLPQACREDLHGFEWRYLWKLCQDESEYSFTDFTDEVRCAAFSPDGILLAVGSGKTVVLLDEIDLMSPKDKRRYILYFLNRSKNSYMVFMLSNNHRVLNELDDSTKSSLQPKTMYFKNYDAQQLQDILRGRAHLLPSTPSVSCRTSPSCRGLPCRPGRGPGAPA